MTTEFRQPIKAALIVVCASAGAAAASLSAVLGDFAALDGNSHSDLHWVRTVGFLALGAALFCAGAASDAFGPERVLVTASGLMAAGSVVGAIPGFVGSAEVLRLNTSDVLLVLGEGAVFTSSLTIIWRVSASSAQRAFLISLWTSGVTIGFGVGPLVATAATTTPDRQRIFLSIALVAMLSMVVFAVSLIPSVPAPAQRLDLRSQILGITTALALAFGVVRGPIAGWTEPQTLLGFALAAALASVHVLSERVAKEPVTIKARILTTGVVAPILAGTIVVAATTGIASTLFLHLTRVRYLDEMETAARLGILALAAALAGALAGRLLWQVGSRVLLVAGLSLMATGVATLSGLGENAMTFDLGWRLTIVGVGVGTVVATTAVVVAHSAPRHLAGTVGATNLFFWQIGAAMGPVLASAVRAGQLDLGRNIWQASQLTVAVIAMALFCSTLILVVGLVSVVWRSDAANFRQGESGASVKRASVR